MPKKKVTIIGAGFVGSTIAQLLIQRDIADVVLVDIMSDMAKGKALDISQSAPILGFDSKITSASESDYGPTKNSDVVVVTAGVARRPGMSRDDLMKTNSAIVDKVTKEAVKESPDCILIIVSNPLDAMVYIAYKASKFPRERIMGMASSLDTMRFKTFVAEELKISHKQINALVIGSHGDTMVPLSRLTKVDETPLSKLLSKEKIKQIEERTRNGGAEIVGLLKTGSAYFSPAAATVDMVQSILKDEKKVLPASVLLEGEYGQKNVFIGVPVVLGKDGVEEIIELKLTEEEKKQFDASAKHIKEVVKGA